jgi:hypothetical protein
MPALLRFDLPHSGQLHRKPNVSTILDRMREDVLMTGQPIEQVRREVKGVVGAEPVEVVLLDKGWHWDDAAPSLFGGDGI